MERDQTRPGSDREPGRLREEVIRRYVEIALPIARRLAQQDLLKRSLARKEAS
ncbi:MAG: hypothetical protein IRZ18_06600 [Clostridia bacterium]|nr:hypothetical protein [Clostridia bacterium]